MGLGPLQRMLDDPTVTEIMVNGHEQIYVERGGRLTMTGMQFDSEEHLRRVIERIVARVGRRIDETSPLVDARLLDGSRVNAIIPPLAVYGSSLTIRKFSDTPYEVDDLVGFGTMTQAVADLLKACVDGRQQRSLVRQTVDHVVGRYDTAPEPCAPRQERSLGRAPAFGSADFEGADCWGLNNRSE